LNYDWILFDADNTLFDFHASSEIAFHKSFEKHGIKSNDGFYQKFNEINYETWKAYDENKLSHEEIKELRFKKLFTHFAIKGIDPLEFNALYFQNLVHYVRYVDGALELLDKLEGKVKMAIITNGMKEVQRPRLIESGLIDRFHLVVVSGEISLSKPNKDFFQYAFDKMACPSKNRVLVVGDNIVADIKGGNEFGFHTAWFNPDLNKTFDEIKPTFEIDSLKKIEDIFFNEG